MPKTASHYVKKGLVSQSDYNFLAEIDPSKTKKYLSFIIKSYLAGVNLDLLRNRVTEYDTLLSRNLADRRDINAFKTFQQLDVYVQYLNNKKSGKERKRDIKKEAEIILETEKVFIVIPHTHEASRLYGAGTKWCTAANNSVHWNKYYYDYLITFYYVQVRDEYKYGMGKDFQKLAVAVYPNGAMEIYDAADRLIALVSAGMKFKPLDDLLNRMGIDKSMFIPKIIDERAIEVSGTLLKLTLAQLDLSKKDISVIPETIGKMTKLESLILSENNIQSLPESIGHLINLKTLYLFHNQLTSLPDSLGNLKGLQWLGLTGNMISNKAIRELKRKLPDTRIYMDRKSEFSNSQAA